MMPESPAIHSHAWPGEMATVETPDLDTSSASHLLWLINVRSVDGTNARMACSIESRDDHGNYYYAAGTTFAAPGQQALSIGPGCPINVVVGHLCRMRFAITGTDLPRVTFESTLYGR